MEQTEAASVNAAEQMITPESSTVGPVRRFFRNLGTGLITGAADDDPSGISTYATAGAAFGYGMLWTTWFSLPLMAAVQLMRARSLKHGLGLQWEVVGETLDADEPKGAFALWSLTWQLNARVQFDGGMRYGLTPTAPRFGVFAGINFAVANLYPSRRK